MLTYPVSEEQMVRLREAHERVKNHPYRANQVGSSKAYGKAYSTMADLFYEIIYTKFRGPRDTTYGPFGPRPGSQHPDRVENFMEISHELNTILYYFAVNEAAPELMVLLEKYLIQIHHFIDTGQWTRYFVWYMQHRNMPRDYVDEWEYVADRNTFEFTDDHLKKYGDKLLKEYSRSVYAATASKDVRAECRYYYERIKNLGVSTPRPSGSQRRASTAISGRRSGRPRRPSRRVPWPSSGSEPPENAWSSRSPSWTSGP